MVGFPKTKRHKDPKLLKSYRTGPCILCTDMRTEGHHIISVGAGGPDASWNLLKVCRIHHTLIHTIGIRDVIRHHRRLLWHLEALGWELDSDKLWHPNQKYL